MLGMFLPVNMGGLTVEEFSENYNAVIDKNEMDYTRLDSEGKWVTEPEEEGH